MRKFYLELDGTRIGLNGENGVFLDTPTGLGVAFTATNTHIGSGFYYQSDYYPNIGSFVGNVEFLPPNAYAHYLSFVNSLYAASTIRLIYDPIGVEYYADATVVSMTKGELTSAQVLTCPLTLNLMGLWYKDEMLTGTSSVSVSAGGQIAPAIVLTTTGTALTNPVITITETATATEVGRVSISGTVDADDTLQYSNLYTDSHLYQTIDGEVTDILYEVNTSYTVFGRTMKPFTVSFSDSSAAFSVKVRRYWRSV